MEHRPRAFDDCMEHWLRSFAKHWHSRVDHVSCSGTIHRDLLVASRLGAMTLCLRNIYEAGEEVHDSALRPVPIVLISILRPDEAAMTAVLADVDLDVRIARDRAIAEEF